MYKITLDDGTVLTKLSLNGNNYSSKTEITQSMFSGNLDHVTIDGPYGREEHGPMKLIQIQRYGDEWWFILDDLSPAEIREQEMKTRQNNADAAIRSIMNILAKFKIPGGGK